MRSGRNEKVQFISLRVVPARRHFKTKVLQQAFQYLFARIKNVLHIKHYIFVKLTRSTNISLTFLLSLK